MTTTLAQMLNEKYIRGAIVHLMKLVAGDHVLNQDSFTPVSKMTGGLMGPVIGQCKHVGKTALCVYL